MAKELSIFIDESGDFGAYDSKSPYYIIGMVFHCQDSNISESLTYLEHGLKQYNFTANCVHVGPLLRREGDYYHMTIVERIRILRKMMNFVAKTDVSVKAFMVEKKHIGDEAEIAAKLAKQIAEFIRQHYPYFLSFDKIKIYYDNGQVEVTKIIVAIFMSLFDNAELKKAFQKDYRLAQVADLVCTAKLTELKMTMHTLSKFERRVLGTDGDIKKYLLKPLRKKEFGEK